MVLPLVGMGQSKLHSDKQGIIQIDITKRYQTIDNFAASDAWSCQFVGNWPDVKRNAIADLLFSRRMKPNGQPEGIGLSMWRFNIGAGSSQQAKSGIKDEWRRTEGFLQSDGSYDWNKQSGQLWFLQAAKQRGVQQFLGFCNSPPVQLTSNKKAFADSSKPNLSTAKFIAFADFLTTVTQNVHAKTGVRFNYLSPVNEPQWDWSNGAQEGTPFTNQDIAGIAKALNTSLLQNKLATKITLAEAGDYKYLSGEADKPDKGNQIQAFLSPQSTTYLGDLKTIEPLIAGHSYFSTSPYPEAENRRKELASKVASVPNLRFWQSEYCILGDNNGEIDGRKRDLGIDAAIYLAKVIHNDLVNANASSWQWWLAVSPYDYKDGLIYIEKKKADGNFYPSKMLWTLGNYSRFILPGAYRVEATEGNTVEKHWVSSYLNETTKELITVVINEASKPKTLTLQIKGAENKNLRLYTTSATKDLEPGSIENGPIILPEKSITTIIADLK